MFPFRDKPDEVEEVLDVEAYVRQRTGQASFVAGLLIFFGFFWFGGPSGSGGLHVGDTLFHYALRFGGLAMVAVAIWLSIGVRSALIGEGVLSVLVGVILVAGAAAMAAFAGPDAGFMSYVRYFIYIVCGFTLSVNGLRTLREYLLLAKLDNPDEADEVDDLGEAEGSGRPPTGAETELTEHAPGRPISEGHRRKDSQAPPPSATPLVRFGEEQKPRRR